MKESDFPQFDDPRVREVFAAAANLVEWYEAVFGESISLEPLKTALFAAQHSRPKDLAPCVACGSKCCYFDEFRNDATCGDCGKWQFIAQHSRPKANHGGYCKHGTGVPCEGCQLAALRDMQEAAQRSKLEEPTVSRMPCYCGYCNAGTDSCFP